MSSFHSSPEEKKSPKFKRVEQKECTFVFFYFVLLLDTIFQGRLDWFVLLCENKEKLVSLLLSISFFSLGKVGRLALTGKNGANSAWALTRIMQALFFWLFSHSFFVPARKPVNLMCFVRPYPKANDQRQQNEITILISFIVVQRIKNLKIVIFLLSLVLIILSFKINQYH